MELPVYSEYQNKAPLFITINIAAIVANWRMKPRRVSRKAKAMPVRRVSQYLGWFWRAIRRCGGQKL